MTCKIPEVRSIINSFDAVSKVIGRLNTEILHYNEQGCLFSSIQLRFQKSGLHRVE